MTSEGSGPIPERTTRRASPQRGTGVPSRRRNRKAALSAAFVVAAVVAGTWGELALTGGVRHEGAPGAADTSQDTLVPAGSATPAAGGSASGSEVFPEPTISADAYHGTRALAVDGADCGKAFHPGTPGATAVPPAGCTGFTAADYVSSGNSVYTSVTVLGFGSAAAAERAAGRVSAADVVFQQPDKLPAMVPQAGPDSLAGKVSAVGRFVTVTVSAYADGRVADQGLQTPVNSVAFAVGESVLWL